MKVRAVSLESQENENDHRNVQRTTARSFPDMDSTPHVKSRSDNPTEIVDLYHLPENTRTQLSKMLALLGEISNGKLGETKGTEHRFALSERSKHYHSKPYRTGPRARQIEHESVD